MTGDMNDDPWEYFRWTQTNATTVCIGQVDLQEGWDPSTGLLERVRIWSSSGSLLYQGFSTGVANGNFLIETAIIFTQVVRLEFGSSPVEVCTAVVNTSNFEVDASVPILCDWVGTTLL